MPPIECKLGYAETPVGNETYVFARDKFGRHVAQVDNLKHVQILLSRPAIYAELRDDALDSTSLTPLEDEIEVLDEEDFEDHPETEEEEAARRAAEADAVRHETLLGSDILPAMVAITPELEVQLGEIVARAHQDSELTVVAWNTLPAMEREALLVKAIEAMQAEATPEPEEDQPAIEPDGPAQDAVVEEPTAIEPPIAALPDDLAILHGIGLSSATKLRNAGVLYFSQLAALSAEAMAALDADLKLNGLSARGNWVQMAKDYLAANPAS